MRAAASFVSRHRGELIVAALLVGGYLVAVNLPVEQLGWAGAGQGSAALLREYAREHVLTCLIPALVIAGAIASLLSKGAVVRTLGADAPVLLSFGVAAVSGSILAVCSCTVLPLFAGIYKRGAGIGPATAFLYSGPAINILAIILTARVLGAEIGIARAAGAVLLALLIGALMAVSFRGRGADAASGEELAQGLDSDEVSLGKAAALIGLMVAGLVLLTWQPGETGWAAAISQVKWWLAVAAWHAVGLLAWRWLPRETLLRWGRETWDLTKKMLPLLAVGVLAAGFLLGSPGGYAGLIPEGAVGGLVGGNVILANLAASVAGALMYFATLTEVPILQGLLAGGMGQGPALALLLAGPALSLPNMLVIRSVLGNKRTAVYVVYVVILSTLAGLAFGLLAGTR